MCLLTPSQNRIRYSFMHQLNHPYKLVTMPFINHTSGSAMAEGPRDALSVEILQLQNIPFEN